MSNHSPPLQRRSQDTLDAISNATKELLRTRSFTEITIQDIVNEANSSAGSFYARFKGKRALLHYLHEELATNWVEDLHAAIDASDVDIVTPTELAERIVPELIRTHAEIRGILRAILIEALEDPSFAERTARLIRTIAETLAGHLTRTAKRKDHHVANVAHSLAAIIAILDQRLFHEKAGSGRISNTETARLKRIFVASLSPEGDR